MRTALYSKRNRGTAGRRRCRGAAPRRPGSGRRVCRGGGRADGHRPAPLPPRLRGHVHPAASSPTSRPSHHRRLSTTPRTPPSCTSPTIAGRPGRCPSPARPGRRPSTRPPPAPTARSPSTAASCARLLDLAGQFVESLLYEPAWPCPPAALIGRLCRVLNGTATNPSGPAEHLPHGAFLAAAYVSAATNRPAAPRSTWRERLHVGPARRRPGNHGSEPARSRSAMLRQCVEAGDVAEEECAEWCTTGVSANPGRTPMLPRTSNAPWS